MDSEDESKEGVVDAIKKKTMIHNDGNMITREKRRTQEGRE